jgi:hypothetical protein
LPPAPGPPDGSPKKDKKPKKRDTRKEKKAEKKVEKKGKGKAPEPPKPTESDKEEEPEVQEEVEVINSPAKPEKGPKPEKATRTSSKKQKKSDKGGKGKDKGKSTAAVTPIVPGTSNTVPSVGTTDPSSEPEPNSLDDGADEDEPSSEPAEITPSDSALRLEKEVESETAIDDNQPPSAPTPDVEYSEGSIEGGAPPACEVEEQSETAKTSDPIAASEEIKIEEPAVAQADTPEENRDTIEPEAIPEPAEPETQPDAVEQKDQPAESEPSAPPTTSEPPLDTEAHTPSGDADNVEEITETPGAPAPNETDEEESKEVVGTSPPEGGESKEVVDNPNLVEGEKSESADAPGQGPSEENTSSPTNDTTSEQPVTETVDIAAGAIAAVVLDSEGNHEESNQETPANNESTAAEIPTENVETPLTDEDNDSAKDIEKPLGSMESELQEPEKHIESSSGEDVATEEPTPQPDPIANVNLEGEDAESAPSFREETTAVGGEPNEPIQIASSEPEPASSAQAEEKNEEPMVESAIVETSDSAEEMKIEEPEATNDEIQPEQEEKSEESKPVVASDDTEHPAPSSEPIEGGKSSESEPSPPTEEPEVTASSNDVPPSKKDGSDEIEAEKEAAERSGDSATSAPLDESIESNGEVADDPPATQDPVVEMNNDEVKGVGALAETDEPELDPTEPAESPRSEEPVEPSSIEIAQEESSSEQVPRIEDVDMSAGAEVSSAVADEPEQKTEELSEAALPPTTDSEEKAEDSFSVDDNKPSEELPRKDDSEGISNHEEAPEVPESSVESAEAASENEDLNENVKEPEPQNENTLAEAELRGAEEHAEPAGDTAEKEIEVSEPVSAETTPEADAQAEIHESEPASIEADAKEENIKVEEPNPASEEESEPTSEELALPEIEKVVEVAPDMVSTCFLRLNPLVTINEGYVFLLMRLSIFCDLLAYYEFMLTLPGGEGGSARASRRGCSGIPSE